MQKTIFVCDRCGAEGALRLRYVSESEPDPSGNGWAEKFGYVDLCHHCAVEVLSAIASRSPSEFHTAMAICSKKS